MFPPEVYRIALTAAKGVGPVICRQLLDIAGDAKDVFESPTALLSKAPHLNHKLVDNLFDPALLPRAAAQYEQMKAHHVDMLFITDENYPTRLRECVDAPLILYRRGGFSRWELPFVLSVVGTRNMTSYGKSMIRSLLTDLASVLPELVIVSGLAYGVDIEVHRMALKAGLRNIAVLAHGLDIVYPYLHKGDAESICSEGGALISEFGIGTPPERFNFVSRNRIIAGISDATLIIESADKGGALITGELASSYGREVLAVPGRVGDAYSQGCNKLIRTMKAALVTSAEDIVYSLGWERKGDALQPTLQFSYPDLPDEPLLNLIAEHHPVHINDLVRMSGLNVREVSSRLFDHELDGYISALPGGLYTLAGR
ncbi:DNA-processing protein DprA [Porphyromonas pogonae]|uniref:DNA-processing protein DprA n=1 Tax=Porphyromonas pogonae TaxID=867595 RepID=UPI002E7A4AE7|nr:DNA-processing protein DprA [Porphyromonas pogonae]